MLVLESLECLFLCEFLSRAIALRLSNAVGVIRFCNNDSQSMFKHNKAPNTTKAEFANTVDPDEPSHLDLQCWHSSLSFFNKMLFILKVFQNFADVILLSAFLALYATTRGPQGQNTKVR